MAEIKSDLQLATHFMFNVKQVCSSPELLTPGMLILRGDPKVERDRVQAYHKAKTLDVDARRLIRAFANEVGKTANLFQVADEMLKGAWS